MEQEQRIQRVADRLFEGEEAVLHAMRSQIREPKRRSPRPLGPSRLARVPSERGSSYPWTRVLP